MQGWEPGRAEPEEEEEEESVATCLQREQERVATSRLAHVGRDVKWSRGPVAEPVPKKIRGTAGEVDDEPGEVAASGSADVATGPTTTEAATATATDVATAAAAAATGPGDEDW